MLCFDDDVFKEMLAKCWKRHCRNHHKDFITYRMAKDAVSEDDAVKATFEDHVSSADRDLKQITDFMEKALRSRKKISNFFQTFTVVPERNISVSVVNDIGPADGCEMHVGCADEPHIVVDRADGSYVNVMVAEENLANTDHDDHRYSLPGQSCASAPITSAHHQKTSRQTLLAQNVCQFCTRIKSWEDMVRCSIQSSIHPMKVQYCHCKEDVCCCDSKIEEIYSTLRQPRTGYVVEDDLPHEPIRSFNRDFFCKRDDEKTLRYFCCKCTRYGQNVKIDTMSHITQWVEGGMVLKGEYRKHQAMTRHLQSVEHKYSLEVERKRLSERPSISLPTKNEMQEATENLCIAVEMMAMFNLPYRFYPVLCTTLHIICRDGRNPLGNNNQSLNVVPKAQHACYEACRDMVSRDLKAMLQATCQSRRIHLCADKGTASKDCSRQAIVATHIGSDGYPCEVLLSVAGIADSTAKGAAQHLTKHVSSLVDTQQVAIISTDGAATYTGLHSGMFKRLKDDNVGYSNKLMYIPDLCHRLERFLENNTPAWVQEVVEVTDKVIAKMNSSHHLQNAVIAEGHSAGGLKYFIMQATCQTRFAEYLHNSLRSFLRNIEILTVTLPRIIASDEISSLTRSNARFILQTVTDPSLITQIMLIDRVYERVEHIEKEAQRTCFGGFEYIRIVSELKELLQVELRKADDATLDITVSGRFRYLVSAKRNQHTATVNLRSMTGNIGQYKAQAEAIRTNYERWLDALVKDYPKYVQISSELSAATDALTLSKEISVADRVTCMRQFLGAVNTAFEPCNDRCLGVAECDCLTKEVESYIDHVTCHMTVQRKVPWEIISSDGSVGYDYSAIIAHYLSDENATLRQELHITNVLRAMEILQLMKASQSATERAFSIVANVISNRFENKYKVNRNGDGVETEELNDTTNLSKDNVEAAVFISMNANVVTLNAALARDKFLSSGHKHALMKSKPRNTVGKAVSTTIDVLTIPKMDRKRKKNCKELQCGSKRTKLYNRRIEDACMAFAGNTVEEFCDLDDSATLVHSNSEVRSSSATDQQEGCISELVPSCENLGLCTSGFSAERSPGIILGLIEQQLPGMESGMPGPGQMSNLDGKDESVGILLRPSGLEPPTCSFNPGPRGIGPGNLGPDFPDPRLVANIDASMLVNVLNMPPTLPSVVCAGLEKRPGGLMPGLLADPSSVRAGDEQGRKHFFLFQKCNTANPATGVTAAVRPDYADVPAVKAHYTSEKQRTTKVRHDKYVIHRKTVRKKRKKILYTAQATSDTFLKQSPQHHTSEEPHRSKIQINFFKECAFERRTTRERRAKLQAFKFSGNETRNISSNIAECSERRTSVCDLSELDSDSVGECLKLLRRHYGDTIGGLEEPGLGSCVRTCTMPRLHAVDTKRFVHIVNVGDHWLTVSNIFGKTSHEVFVYDSLYTRVQSQCEVEVTSLLRTDELRDTISYHMRGFAKQRRGSRFCGFYAVGAAFSCVLRHDPTGFAFDEKVMRQHLQFCLENNKVIQFPGKTGTDISETIQVLSKKHCRCHRSSGGSMLQCSDCSNWYHQDCLQDIQSSSMSPSVRWKGPCCL